VSDPEGTIVGLLCEKPRHDGCLQLRDFKKAFYQLSEDQREVLLLLGAAGLTYEEAAETCGVAIGTIKSRANRARTRLAELMGIDGTTPMELTDARTFAVVTNWRAAA
jgi:RNA polymerase sigma-70 factor (ECF subfamily)